MYREILIGTGPPGGRAPWAYSIDVPMPECVNLMNGFFYRTYYDCEGKAMHGIHSSICGLRTDLGVETVRLVGYGAPMNANPKPLGAINDIRTLKMIIAGCCPPAIEEAILEGI